MFSGCYRQYARDIHGSAEPGLALVIDLLDISVIETGQRALSLKCLSVKSVIRDCLVITGDMADCRLIDIRFEPILERLEVLANERALKQVLLKLFTNSLKLQTRVAGFPSALPTKMMATGYPPRTTVRRLPLKGCSPTRHPSRRVSPTK